jgi:hypothetical protein
MTRLAYNLGYDRHGHQDADKCGASHIVNSYNEKLCDGKRMRANDVQYLGGDPADEHLHDTCKRCLKKHRSDEARYRTGAYARWDV